MAVIQKEFQYGDRSVKLETGGIARQADGAVMVSMGDTVVLVTVVGVTEPQEGRGFFPLTVHYFERRYAAGKVPGGYFKREGRPTEKEVLTSRLIDRPLRPLFPDYFLNEVQIIATVLSMDEEVNPDVPALIGASAALAISGIPFAGPIGAARVGYSEGIFLLNPTEEHLKESKLDLVVAGTSAAVLMVESEAKELPEDIMLSAVLFGHEQMQTAIQAINEFASEVGVTSWEWEPPKHDEATEQRIVNAIEADLANAYQISEKLARQTQVAELRNKVLQFAEEEQSEITAEEIKNAFSRLEKKIVRSRILEGQRRIDGRDTKTVRPITIETGILPRTHGSVVFTRGETQALVTTTLGTERDAQTIEGLSGEGVERFLLHYNFPPYCVGETGMVGSPKRREIGHGRLAKRAMQAVLPGQDEFPYVLRIVSEVTESNGSSSMATVCGTSLALMDTGVPINAQVAGIAMGLIKEGEQFAVLTDILGDEDHLGDMDFKVAGTSNGITALQMDIKIEGITKEIMGAALEQAKEGRMHILNLMDQAISKPRIELSIYAPRIITMKIPKEKIGNVIGKGGATIRELTETTGATIDISEEGVVKIAAVGSTGCEEAHNRIEELVADVEVGKIYEGKVLRIMEFGAFVSILPGKDGLVHISQIASERVKDVHDHVQEGQTVTVKVLEIDRQGRVKLSMKEAKEVKESS